MLIDWPLGTIVVTRPKTLEFYEQLSNHRATLIRADGKDILSVKMHLNSEGLAEKDAEVVTPDRETSRIIYFFATSEIFLNAFTAPITAVSTGNRSILEAPTKPCAVVRSRT